MLLFQAAFRETREETGVELDLSFIPVMVGGWNIASSRDRHINDHYIIYLSRARSEQLQLDNWEISRAQWKPINDLMPLLDTLIDGKFAQYLQPVSGVGQDTDQYSGPLLFGLRRYLRGLAIEVVHGQDTTTRRVVFI